MNGPSNVDRQSMDVDIVCVGFGPATGGFLTTLSRAMVDENGQPLLASRIMPGMPIQVLCYERSNDTSFGVSGVVSKARGIRASFPDLDLAQIPLAHPVTKEKVLCLLDPVGASRRSSGLKAVDKLVQTFKWMLKFEEQAVELPYIPGFLKKEDGLVFSMGQFNQWVSSQLMAGGLVQIWPAMPVERALVDHDHVTGVRLADQGTDKDGNPDAGYIPGMDIRAQLTVVGDGPIGPVGRQLDEHFGLPDGHHQRDWAVGMKMVVELPESCTLEPGTVLHTFGYPEPEIFGFFYVYPDRLASIGIFVPSWLDSPVRGSYRYLQHWMMHPYLWRHLNGGTMRSWGAKTLQESGRRGEPHLAGNGFARIGEGSGSTNVLTGSGTDEAWTTGVQLAEGVIELLKDNQPLDKANLERAYVNRRRDSWLEKEGRVAEKARDGFQKGFLTGLIGTAISGWSGGTLNLGREPKRPRERVPSLEAYFKEKITPLEIQEITRECAAAGTSIHSALMERAGWPKIPHDGKLLVSQQEALLVGGKVQVPPGYPDHVVFLYPSLCHRCKNKLCIEVCPGQAITPGHKGVPQFDKKKCVHCGACVWSCTRAPEDNPEGSNVQFRAGAGGLHSAEN